MLVSPIGLEDWKALGVPWRSVDDWYRRDLQTSAEGIRQYQQATYYAGEWRPEFDRWVQMQAGMYRGKGRESVAWNSALTYDDLHPAGGLRTGPVADADPAADRREDNTAIGGRRAGRTESQAGQLRATGQDAARRIPQATLVEFPDLGHTPQIQAPERFHQALLKGLQTQP